jgi:HSP20 family protein
LFEEETHLLLLAEMPGVASEDVQLSFADRSLTIEGTSKTAHFKSHIELPQTFTMEQVSIAANNGVIEIRLALA